MLAAKGEIMVGWCCVVGVYGKFERKSNTCGQIKFACQVAMMSDSLRLSSLQINPPQDYIYLTLSARYTHRLIPTDR